MQPRNVAVLIFDDAEVLDFCGPFEVFSVTGKRDGSNPFNVYLVAEKTPIVARGGFSINPHYTLDNCPTPDILVVPGGGGYREDGTPLGTRREMHNQTVLAWILRHFPENELVLSVCTGAFLIAKAGLADGLAATTHHKAFDVLREIAPHTDIREDERIVDNGKIVFSGGISAGIDASFHVVARLLGEEVAQETASYMEYDWRSVST